MAQCDVAATNPSLLRVLAEGATRFLHHQICEIAADCLQKSRDDQLTSGYFCKMSLRLEETLAEAQQKTSAESLKFLASISKQVKVIKLPLIYKIIASNDCFSHGSFIGITRI
jgi:hypothetical protein